MSHVNDLEDFVNDLSAPVKIAETDLDNLSLPELEALMGLDLTEDNEKVAYLDACVKSAYGDDRYGSWLDQFEGSPLKAKALALCEQELALEQERLQKRIERDAQCQDDSATWTKQDMLRLQKDMLMLELHKSNMGQGGGKDPALQPPASEPVEAPAAEPAASEPEKKSALKEAVSKDWIRKMVGSGGAKASPQRLNQFIDRSYASEIKLPGSLKGYKAQQKRMTARHEAAQALMDKRSSVAMAPVGVAAAKRDAEKMSVDIQTVGQINNGDPNQPSWPRASLGVDAAGRRATPEEENAQRQAGMDVQFRKAEASKSAGAATQLGEAVMKHVDRMPGVAQRALGHAHNLGARLGGKTTEQAMGRGLMAVGGGAAAAGAAGAGALATRKKESSAAVEAARGLPFDGEKSAVSLAELAKDARPGGKLMDRAIKFDRNRNLAAGAAGGLALGGLAAYGAHRARQRKKKDMAEAVAEGIRQSKEASVMGTLAMDAGSQAKHLARLGSYARNVQKVPHAVVAARNAEMRAAKALPMPHVDLNAPRPMPAGPTTVATKKTPTQAIDRMALPRHLAQTNPQQAIQAGRQFGAPVVGNAAVLDQLSQMSFGKLSVSKSWITRVIRRAKATKLRVRDSAQKHDAAWWDHRVKGTELTDAAKKRGLAADELADKFKSMKGAMS